MQKIIVMFTLGFVLSFSSSMFATLSEAELMKQAKIDKVQAEKIALRQVPHGRFVSEELEKENGKLVWSFDIAKAGTKNVIEVQVDAKTGKVVSTKIETPADQAKEAKADRKK